MNPEKWIDESLKCSKSSFRVACRLLHLTNKGRRVIEENVVVYFPTNDSV